MTILHKIAQGILDGISLVMALVLYLAVIGAAGVVVLGVLHWAWRQL